MKLWLAANTLVLCPKCGKDLYRLRTDVVDGTHIASALFEPLPGVPTVLDGLPNPCPECGHHWFPQWFTENLPA